MIATKRKIETEEDRYGGFNRTYDSNLFTSTIASPSVVGPSYEEVPQEVFEVEKEYKMDDDLEKYIETPKKSTVMQTISRTDKIKKSETYNKNSKLKINAHGKVLLTVFSCIVCLLVGFSIYNAVVISRISGEVASKQVAVAELANDINGITTEIENMSSESSINAKLDNSFRKVTDSDKVYLEQTSKAEVPEYEKTTNFFDKLCEFFSNIF